MIEALRIKAKVKVKDKASYESVHNITVLAAILVPVCPPSHVDALEDR